MNKKTLYTIFIAKFLFSLALIFWTVKVTLGAGVGKDNDNVFMGYYHDVDKNFNQIILNNKKFEAKYNIKIIVNEYAVNSLTYEDIYLSQRVIKERKERKNILHIGQNKVSVEISDKLTNKLIDTFEATILFTMPSTHEFNKELKLSQAEVSQNIVLDKKSYWNIMGTIKVQDETGQFYLKTNAI